MIYYREKEINGIHSNTQSGVDREITAVYRDGVLLWELIKGFLFTKDGYALQTKDDYILKAKDQ